MTAVSSIGRNGEPSPDSRPEVAATVRLLHRRRGWAWTAAGSFIGLCVYAVIGSHFFPNPPGAAGAVNGLAVIVLLGLTIVGLVVAIVDTVRLHRLAPETKAHALGRTSHHPVIAHAYRYPPHHRFSWVFSRLLLAAWVALTIGFLPAQVNSAAYLVGAGHNVTFLPQSYGQDCGRSGCTTVTNGILATGGSGTKATWPGQAPLDLPFTVRGPVWSGWGSVQLVGDTAGAVIMVIFGLFLDAVSVLAVISIIKFMQHWMARQMQRRRQPAAAPGS
jgi:hypothetical protein